MKRKEVAKGVRVRLNKNWKQKSIGDRYLEQEPVIFISQPDIYNDARGESVMIKGGSYTNSGYAYLDELDLEFPMPERSMYRMDKDMSKVELALLLQERDLIEKRIEEIDPKALLDFELNKYNKELKDIGFNSETKKFEE